MLLQRSVCWALYNFSTLELNWMSQSHFLYQLTFMHICFLSEQSLKIQLCKDMTLQKEICQFNVETVNYLK